MDLEATQMDPKSAQVDLEAAQVDPKNAQVNLDAAQVDPKSAQVDLEAAQVDPKSAQVDLEAPRWTLTTTILNRIPALIPIWPKTASKKAGGWGEALKYNPPVLCIYFFR